MLRRELEKRERTLEELRSREDEARKLSLVKSEFIANMSHEFRSPMSAIIGMMDLAAHTDGVSEQVREYVALARESGASLLAMIDHLLEFSRIEAGQLKVDSVAFSLRGTVGDSLKPLAFEAGRKNLKFSCEIAPELGDLFVGDPMRLRQVLVNLTGNAIKFTARGGITVRIECAGSSAGNTRCRFSVSDTGIGIPRDRQAEIFAPFEQAAPSTARVYGGSGLGLTISARLVEMMSGSIRVESEEGRGTTFSFEIPLALQPMAAAVAGESARHVRNAAQAGFPRLDILLVDDNAINRRVAQAVLEHAGHLVTPPGAARPRCGCFGDNSRTWCWWICRCRGWMEGRRRRRSAKPNARPACASRSWRSPHPCLPDDGVRCLEAGMDGCMTKPIDPDQLLRLLARIATAAAPDGAGDLIDAGLVLDRDALLERVGGDAEILREITAQFLDEHVRLMNSVRRAIANRDPERFNHAVHTLLGMFRSLAAEAAQAVTGRLESCSLSEGLGQARAGVALLEKAVHALKSELVAFAGATPGLRRSFPRRRRCGPTRSLAE
jgi:nitrogen-specific signal transduction histidine kinase/HPt (histidine-containing phosphotransfer) domain-containing protein